MWSSGYTLDHRAPKGQQLDSQCCYYFQCTMRLLSLKMLTKVSRKYILFCINFCPSRLNFCALDRLTMILLWNVTSTGVYIVQFDHFPPPSFEIIFFPRRISLRRALILHLIQQINPKGGLQPRALFTVGNWPNRPIDKVLQVGHVGFPSDLGECRALEPWLLYCKIKTFSSLLL